MVNPNVGAFVGATITISQNTTVSISKHATIHAIVQDDLDRSLSRSHLRTGHFAIAKPAGMSFSDGTGKPDAKMSL
jgi:hypothetical protein